MKVKGEFYYFGTDAAEVEAKWGREEADVLGSHPVERTSDSDLTVRQMVNPFLTAKRTALLMGNNTGWFNESANSRRASAISRRLSLISWALRHSQRRRGSSRRTPATPGENEKGTINFNRSVSHPAATEPVRLLSSADRGAGPRSTSASLASAAPIRAKRIAFRIAKHRQQPSTNRIVWDR